MNSDEMHRISDGRTNPYSDEMHRIIRNQHLWAYQYHLNKKNENNLYKKRMVKEQIDRRIRQKNNIFKENFCGFNGDLSPY